MRWTKSTTRSVSRNAGVPPAVRRASGPPIVSVPAIAAWSLILSSTLILSGAAPEKRLTVYSVAANYSLPLVQREGRAYVGLFEVLEPLGKVNAKSEGPRWRLRYNNSVEGDFQAGKTHARVQGRDADL